MIIDLTDLINCRKSKIMLDSDINFKVDLLSTTTIRRLENVHFSGYIAKLIDDTYDLIGTITGKMILPDDITLEDYEYTFTSEIEENVEENSINLNKTLDITSILWENILVEVPLKAVNKKNENITLEGDGWRLIKEEDIKEDNNPLSSLEDLIRKE